MNYDDVLLSIDGVDIKGKHHCSTNIPKQTLIQQPDQE